MNTLRQLRTLLLGLAILLPGTQVFAQQDVSYERILNAQNEPENWLTYNGSYASQRYSTLNQITRDNVDQLELKWVFRTRYSVPGSPTPS